MTTEPTTRSHAARDVVVQLVGRLVNLGLGVVVTIVVTRSLGVDDFGQWAAFLAIVTIVGAVADLGLAQVAVREAAAAPADRAAWLGALVGWRALLAVPAALIALGLELLVAHGTSQAVAGALLAATLLAGVPAALSGAMFQLQVRNDRSVAVMTLNSVLWTAGAAAVAALGGGLLGFAAVLLASSAFTAVLGAGWALRTGEIALRGVREHGRTLLRVGVVVGIGATLTVSYGKVDQVLVLHYTGEHGAGLYGTAYLLLDRAQFAPMALIATIYPLLSAAWPADPERSRRIVQQGIEYMAIVSLPAFGFTLLAGRPLIRLLFGADFAPAGAILPVLMAAFVLTSLGYVAGYLALIVGRQGRFVGIAAAALVLNVVLNVILLPRYGYQAAAWVTLASEVIVIAAATRTTFPVLGLRVAPGRLPQIVAATAVMTAAVWALREAGAGIVVLIAAAGLVYAAALPLTGGLRQEDRRLVLSLLRRRPAPAAE